VQLDFNVSKTAPRNAGGIGQRCWIGVDVAKQWIDVLVLVDERPVTKKRWQRTPEALAESARQMQSYAPQACPGGHRWAENGGDSGAASRGLPVMRVHPKRIRDFARAHGLLAKSDALDAFALALFGTRMRPPLRAFPNAERQQLAQAVARLPQASEPALQAASSALSIF
jgi:transposase